MSSAPGSTGSPGPGRRRPRRAALAVAVAVLALATAGALVVVNGPGLGMALTVRTPDGHLVASLPVEEGDEFAVSYRNSIYRTLAEERYRVLRDGRFELVELAADQVAVLEEYYAVPTAPRPAPSGDRRQYVAEPSPAGAAVFDVLNIAATDLGERTVWVPGSPPVPVWQHVVSDDPTVLLEIEETR